MNLFPISVLFAGLTFAPIAVAQVPTSATAPIEEGEAAAPVPPAQPEAVELADCLAAVYSLDTANAAAARAAELCARLEKQGGEETFWGRLHMAYADCYGSDALRRALQPVLPPADTVENPDFQEALPLLHEIWQTLQDIRTCLDSVQDKATADAAAEPLVEFSNHIADCLNKGNTLTPPKGNRIDLVIYYFSGEYRRTGAVFKAWGDLQNRSGDYYGSDALAAAMEDLSTALENLDLSADLYAIGQMVLACSKMEEMMCHWLEIAAGVSDKATADAAAAQLRACTEGLHAVAAGLGQGYEKDLGHVSPRFLFLSLSCDRLVQGFARHDFFGSDDLRQAVEF